MTDNNENKKDEVHDSMKEFLKDDDEIDVKQKYLNDV